LNGTLRRLKLTPIIVCVCVCGTNSVPLTTDEFFNTDFTRIERERKESVRYRCTASREMALR
jgi:hypothetical protein